MTAAALLELLGDRGLTLATAESLTGGLLADTFVRVPGASAVFRGGLVTYATELKTQLLGVDADLLAACGPIHPEVARQMADGVRKVCSADIGIGTTGVAGPDPQDGHEAGEVYVAVAGPGGVLVRQLTLTGDRAAIRQATVDAVLELATSDRAAWLESE